MRPVVSAPPSASGVGVTRHPRNWVLHCNLAAAGGELVDSFGLVAQHAVQFRDALVVVLQSSDGRLLALLSGRVGGSGLGWRG